MDIKTEGTSSQPRQISNDVQSYLIDNYREAVRQGDRSAAKSCLLAARYFSVNDPIVMNEIYLMAKSDGDVNEASKCFASLIKLLLPQDGNHQTDSSSPESPAVLNRIKDEIALYLSQLKSKLHLKSTPPPGLNVTTTGYQPKESNMAMRLNETLNHFSRQSRSESLFYQQLFENLPADVNTNIINHTIDSSEDQFEQCRLMLLSMSVFPDSVDTYGNKLLAKLIEIIKKNNTKEGHQSREYASSLLVLDAIPMVLNLTSVSNLSLDVSDLFAHVLYYYSNNCLDLAAKEFEFSELYDGLKKSIADRILCKETNHKTEVEESINSTFDLLFEKYLQDLTDPKAKSLLHELREIVISEPDVMRTRLVPFIKDLIVMNDVPSQSLPPKARGRAKKVQTPPIGSDQRSDSPSTLIKVALSVVVRRLFHSSASYLRETRTRVLIEFVNPFERSLKEKETELNSLARFRESHKVTEIETPAVVKLLPGSMMEKHMLARRNRSIQVGQPSSDSPLNSAHSRKMDHLILVYLCEISECLYAIQNSTHKIQEAWTNFIGQGSIADCNWYFRISADTAMFNHDYYRACNVLGSFLYGASFSEDDTVTPTQHHDSSLTVAKLRAYAQFICCQTKLSVKEKAFFYIDQLLSELRLIGLATARDNYATGDVMDEYKVFVCRGLGFLFFDSLPLIRYCIDTLTSVLDTAVQNAPSYSDTLIGHTIVLTQFDWPKNAHIYESCIEWIRSNKPKSATPQCLSNATKFTYPEFFQYVKNPNFIEDFMALLNQGFTLDFKDGSTASSQSMTQPSTSRSNPNTPTRSGKAITTRGVNKSFKEDLKVALIAQMKSSLTFIPLDLMLEFIQAFLLPYLTRTMGR